jgi:hypothetical protein
MQRNKNKTKSSRKEVQKQNLTTYQGRSSEEPSSLLAEEGRHPEVWQESSCHHHRQRKESERPALLSPRLDQRLQRLRASPKYTTWWARPMPTLLESHQIHAQDIRHLQAGLDSIGLLE